MFKKILAASIILVAISNNAYAFEATMTSSVAGCTEDDKLKKLLGYARDQDKEAFAKALMLGITDGTCTLFEEGERVFVTDVGVLSGLNKVRKKGSPSEFWVIREAVHQ